MERKGTELISTVWFSNTVGSYVYELAIRASASELTTDRDRTLFTSGKTPETKTFKNEVLPHAPSPTTTTCEALRVSSVFYIPRSHRQKSSLSDSAVQRRGECLINYPLSLFIPEGGPVRGLTGLLDDLTLLFSSYPFP